jgi:polyisoprenoid-binding protein YceI
MQRMTKIGALGAAGAMGLFLLTNTPAPVAHAHAPATVAAAPAPLTGAWTIDPAHTNVNFAIGHLGISAVRGRFGDVSGMIVADSARPEKSSIAVTIKTASVDTGVAMRDNHLKTADFFDAEKHPEITFKSTRIEKTRRGFVARGDLTMHGVTRAVSLPFRVNGPIVDGRGQSHVGAETRLTLNRRDFGMNYGSLLSSGSLDVANDVDVTISLEAIPATVAAN